MDSEMNEATTTRDCSDGYLHPMYCDVCGDDRAFRRELRPAVVEVRGESIEVQEPSLLCTHCGAVQPDLTGGVDSIKLANDEYRRRHNLLTSDQIRRIREQYDLSREAFAAVLGMSPATLYRYEAGAIQDEVQDSLIYACSDPPTMERLLRRKQMMLGNLQQRRFDSAISKLKARVESGTAETLVRIGPSQPPREQRASSPGI